MKTINFDRKLRKKIRISGNIFGTSLKPRIAIFRSNKYIYAQAIDDDKRITLAAASSFVSKNKDTKEKHKKVDQAKIVGLTLAKILKEKKIDSGVFDRSIYLYKGRVKNLAEGLREGGLKI